MAKMSQFINLILLSGLFATTFAYGDADEYEDIRNCKVDGEAYIRIMKEMQATSKFSMNLMDDSKIAAIRKAASECKASPREKELIRNQHLNDLLRNMAKIPPNEPPAARVNIYPTSTSRPLITVEGEKTTSPSSFGSLLLCPNGYKLDGATCNKIYIPDNAMAIGSDWMCNSGYKKYGNQCVKFEIPINAMYVLDGWRCKIGYTEHNGQCIRKDWDKLNADAELYFNKAINSQIACEKLCDKNYYSEQKNRCNDYCKGNISDF